MTTRASWVFALLLPVTSCEEKKPAAAPSNEQLLKFAVDEIQQNQTRSQTLDEVDRTTVPFLSDFLRLYPDASIRYLSFSGAQFPSFSATATLYDRYVFNLRIPVFYSKDNKKVERYGDPLCYFIEIIEVMEHDGVVSETPGDLQKTFGKSEWDSLASANGDFSVMGINLVKDQPVANFELIKEHH